LTVLNQTDELSDIVKRVFNIVMTYEKRKRKQSFLAQTGTDTAKCYYCGNMTTDYPNSNNTKMFYFLFQNEIKMIFQKEFVPKKSLQNK